MRYDDYYYERIWEYDRRRREQEQLNLALAEACDHESTWHRLKLMLGHSMMNAGARLAEEPIPVTHPVAR